MIDLREMLWGDVFAGFGGTSTGFKEAFGRPPDFAINHWDLAIKVHKRNHRETRHYTESVWRLDPRRVTRGRIGEVRAFLTAYYGEDGAPGCGQDLREPMRTLTAKARLGLVTIKGVDYQLTDICFRMLTAPELLRGQMGELAEGYDISDAETQEDQVAGIGNMVPPHMVAALLRANVPATRRRRLAA